MLDVPNMGDIDWIPKSGENLMTQEINGGTCQSFPTRCENASTPCMHHFGWLQRDTETPMKEHHDVKSNISDILLHAANLCIIISLLLLSASSTAPRLNDERSCCKFVS